MTQDAINLSIYRRNGSLFVAAGVSSGRGLRNIALLAVEEGPDGLLHALETSEQLALELTRAKPRDKRFTGDEPKPDWSIAGVSTQAELVMDGGTKVSVLRRDKSTELAFWVPNDHGGLVRTILKQALPGKTPLKKVAGAVAEMFERADREKPRVETVDDLDDE